MDPEGITRALARSSLARLGALILAAAVLIVLVEAAPHQVHHLAPTAGDEGACVLAVVVQQHQASLPSLGPPFVVPEVSWASVGRPADPAGACLPRSWLARAPPA